MDHFPFYDGERALLLRAICAALGVGSIAGAAPIAREMAADAARNGDLMAKARFLTGKPESEIRALAAQSPLCFADFVAQLTSAPARPPGSTPARDPVPVAPPAATRFVLRYGVMECVTCGYAKEFCRGHSAPDAITAQDGAAAASLNRRVADCQGR